MWNPLLGFVKSVRSKLNNQSCFEKVSLLLNVFQPVSALSEVVLKMRGMRHALRHNYGTCLRFRI